MKNKQYKDANYIIREIAEKERLIEMFRQDYIKIETYNGKKRTTQYAYFYPQRSDGVICKYIISTLKKEIRNLKIKFHKL